MLDRRRIREEPDQIKEGVAKKNVQIDVDRIVGLDRLILANIKKGDELKHERNVKSKEIGKRKQAGESADEIHAHMKSISQQIKDVEAESKELEDELDALLLTIPNLPHASVPEGTSPDDNVVVRTSDSPSPAAQADFDVVPHWDLGERLGVLDLEGGRRVSGRGFVAFRGDGALLVRALVNAPGQTTSRPLH